MKTLKLVIILVLVFLVGYAVGNFVPFSSFSFSGISQPDISGPATLEVRITASQ